MRTVLAVDDDPDVRKIAVEILRTAGYRVIEAASPAQALEALALEPSVELLFTDIMMPEMSGFELSRRAKQIHPGLRVLYTTGNTITDKMKALLVEGTHFLSKPYTEHQLQQSFTALLAA